MNTRNKKNTPDLPFTQLWYNFKASNHAKQSNKPNHTAKLPKQSSKPEHELLSGDLYPNKQRRASQACMGKRSSVNYSNERISMMLQDKDKENCELNNMSSVYYVEECNTSAINTHNNKSLRDDTEFRNSSLTSHNRSNDRTKITDQILQVVERNIIPFLVDKFIQSESRANQNIERMEEIISKQNEQIFKLKEREKILEEAISKMDRKIEGLNNNPKDQQCFYQEKDTFSRTVQEKHKTLENRENGNRAKKAITQNNDQSQAGIKQIGRLLEDLTITMEKSAAKNTQQICSLQKQVKKITERQKISQQKLQQEFASRILELITTYNDNFVDLDKRIGQLESQKNENTSANVISLGKVVSITGDKQKTNRYE